MEGERNLSRFLMEKTTRIEKMSHWQGDPKLTTEITASCNSPHIYTLVAIRSCEGFHMREIASRGSQKSYNLIPLAASEATRMPSSLPALLAATASCAHFVPATCSIGPHTARLAAALVKKLPLD